jgi:hypothetical protein
VKDDAVIRVPRWSWTMAKKYADKSGRDLREVGGEALRTYVKLEESREKAQAK